MASNYTRVFRGDEAHDLAYRIDDWCKNHGCQPISISVIPYGSNFVAFVILEENDDGK